MTCAAPDAERCDRDFAQLMALNALEVICRPVDSLRLDPASLQELIDGRLIRVDDEVAHLDERGYALLERERRAKELARPDRHPCRCGAPVARFETTCMRCVAAGQRERMRQGR